MTCENNSVDWSQGFALFEPLNECSQVAVKARLNRRHQVKGFRHTHSLSTNPKRQIAIKLDFSMLLGRRCISFGTSRANNITLPKGHGIGNVHFYVHLHPVTRILLLTVMAKSEVIAYDDTTSEKTLVGGETITISKTTRISFGARRRFEFTIVPTLESIRNADMERMFKQWLKSIPEPTTQIMRPSVMQTDAVTYLQVSKDEVECAV